VAFESITEFKHNLRRVPSRRSSAHQPIRTRVAAI
jgi:hypothetical protein